MDGDSQFSDYLRRLTADELEQLAEEVADAIKERGKKKKSSKKED